MVALTLAAMAAVGTYLLLAPLWSAGHHDPRPPRRPWLAQLGGRLQAWMRRSGLEQVSPAQFLATSAAVGVAGAMAGIAVFGPGVPALAIGIGASLGPAALWRRRRRAAHEAAAESWPRMIEELRVLTGSVGRPVPQALLEVGLNGPVQLRGAFEAAQREWSLTTDFERLVCTLKDRLDDPTADATCETLLVAYDVGGDLDSRLAALAEDRRVDLRDRRESEARQAGARLARWFVIIVPLGMGFAGANLGNGAEAFRSPGGQVAAAVAIAMVVGCWLWAGRIMQLPRERRVFHS